MARRHWVAAILFMVLALALTNPLVFHVWDAVEDKQDALLNTWIMAWVGHAAIANPLNLYNTNIFYPYSDTLAFSEPLVPQGLLALPLTFAAHNPIFGYNSVLIGMLWLDAFGMYLLTVAWTGRREAGWVTGVVFAFNPFNLGNLAQVQLLALGWLPLALLSLQRMLRPQRAILTRDLLLFALFFMLQSLSSIYYALISGVAIVAYLAYAAALAAGRSIGSLSRQESRGVSRETGAAIARLALAAGLIALILTPFLLPYLSVQQQLGFQRKIQDAEPFSANLRQFTEVSPQNLVYGKWLAPQPVHYEGGYPLDNLFPGVLALLLAGIGLAGGNSRLKWFSLGVFLIGFVLALGPRLYLSPTQPTGVILPYRWLYDLFAPLRALRAPVRFEALIMLALALLAGFGITVVTVRRERVSPYLSLGWALLIAVEYLSVPAANIAPMRVSDNIPNVYRWLAEQPPGVVLELPMMGPGANRSLDISTEYYTTYHWQATPDGYSGFVPGGRGAIAYEMQFFPNPRAISLLQALDVRYVILHWDELSKIPGSPGPADLEDASGLLPVREDEESSVYAVPPNLQMPWEMMHQLYVPQPVAAGSPFTAFVILGNSGWPIAAKPTDRVMWTARWSIGGAENVSTAAPLVTSSAAVVAVPLTAPAREGKWWLELQANPGPLGSFTLKEQVEVGSERADELVIPARVESAAPLASSYHPGETVDVLLNWLPLNKIDAYYSTSVRIVNEKGEKIVASDREPQQQTLLWIPDSIVEDHFDLTLPGDVPPGKYRVEVLMYASVSGTSVLLLDEQYNPVERVELGEFEVR